MTTFELKSNLHSLIDSIDNEQLLLNFYELIKSRASVKEGNLWSRLTNGERAELLLALNECEDENNLINHKEMIEKHKRWL